MNRLDADDPKRDVDFYSDGRDHWKIWSEDLTPNEEYLAAKAFKEGSLEEARKWGNHLLEILKAKSEVGTR